MTNIQVFKELCQDLHQASQPKVSYTTVVLKVLQTRYAKLLPEEMELPDIAYVLDIPYKTVSNISNKVLGISTSPNSKSLLRVLANRMHLKDFVHEKILDDDLTHELIR